MKTSEDYTLRLRHEANLENAGIVYKKPERPSVLGGQRTPEEEYPTEDINPDDIPF